MSQVAELDITDPRVSLKDAKDYVKHMLATNNRWLLKALMAIYAKQTQQEQSAEQTNDRNNVGFNSADSNILTGYAKQWQQREWVSEKQLVLLRRKMPKYAGQLVMLARSKPRA